MDEAATVLERVDQLYEFEREAVTPERFESARHFAAVFAGEHVAGTEFVIGALFVSWGASAANVLGGLVLGNLLAVLSWTFICAPIAVQTRLTLYWYLRQIAGPAITALYNVLNAILFGILCGTMITVSASAIRIPFDIPPQTNWYPQDARFVFVVLGVGAVVVSVAILGFRRLAQFSEICVPWIFVMFFVGALAMLPELAAATPGVDTIDSWHDLWRIATEKVWVEDATKQIGLWHVAAFAWICNLAFHVGLSDMALLRYAPRASYGLLSACGMYLGHFLAWVCAGVMGVAVATLLKTPLVQLDAGEVAYRSLGFSGALAVVLAGWSTSNPTLYRAGLALQAVTPGWPRWIVTLVAGIATTIIACFPFVFGYLLEFVAVFGLLLMPVGAVVFIEHWVFPRLGWTRYWATLEGRTLNWPALVAWLVAVAASTSLYLSGTIDLVFLALPMWLLTSVVYLMLAATTSARRGSAVSMAPPSRERPASPIASSVPKHNDGRSLGIRVVGWIAVVTLLACLGLAGWVAFGEGDHAERLRKFHFALAWLSVVHLACVGLWILRSEQAGHAA